MWKPADNVDWHSGAMCKKPEYAFAKEWFFPKNSTERHSAKAICYECPVRKNCLQWSLEHKQIWGVWGGKDEVDLRRTLSVNADGEEAKRRRPPNCPHCGARPSKLETGTAEIPNGGRWKVAKIVTCIECKFVWRSRTSANAVEAYHKEKASKEEKRAKEREKKARKRSKSPSE